MSAREKLLYVLQSGPGLSILTPSSLELEEFAALTWDERLLSSVVLVKTGTSCLFNLLTKYVDLEIYIRAMVNPRKGTWGLDYEQCHTQCYIKRAGIQ